MSATKVACPMCGTALKTGHSLPSGVKVQCPKCRATFKIHSQSVASAGQHSAARMPATASVRPAHLPDGSTATVPASKVPPQRSSMASIPDSQPLIDPVRPRNSMNRGMIIGSVVFLLLAGVAMSAFLIFGGSDKAADKKKNGRIEIRVQQHKRPKIVKVPLIALTQQEEDQVKKMTEKAIGFVKNRQNADGSWSMPGHKDGLVGMAGLTLLECGVAPTDKSIQDAAQYARGAAQRMTRTYDLSLTVLFLNRLDDPKDKELIEELTFRIVAGQLQSGGWSYQCPILSQNDQKRLSTFLTAMGKRKAEAMRKGADPSFRSLSPRFRNMAILTDWEKQPDSAFLRGGDNSNTQFALLALWAARKHKIPVFQPLRFVVERFRRTQTSGGIWGYSGPRPISKYPSMTCAGSLGLAAGYGIEDGTAQTSPKKDAAIQKALKIIGRTIGKKNAPGALPHMYYLWSMERVAVLFHLKQIDGKDWYHWGMNMLKARQSPNGSWRGGPGPGTTNALVDTCFALLFLQRANLAADLTDKLQELEEMGQVAAVGSGKKD